MAAPTGGAGDRRSGGSRPGDVLRRRYRLVDAIAADRRSEVWTARDEILDRTVLVKFRRLAAGDGEARDRFHQEALGVARLSHPGIVAVYDTILEGPATALVLEHVQATPLSRFLHDGGAVSPTEAVSIASQVADALEAAHSSGVHHRNLSPDSVWLCSDQRVKITDFGTAWEGAGDETDPAAAAIDGEQADVRALALVLRSCLSATAPVEQPSAPLREFIDRALTPRSEGGFASVAEARAQLADIHGPAPVSPDLLIDAPAPTRPPAEGARRPARTGAVRARRRIRAVPLLAAAAIAAIALSVTLLSGDAEPPAVTSPPIAPAADPDTTLSPEGAGEAPTPAQDSDDEVNTGPPDSETPDSEAPRGEAPDSEAPGGEEAGAEFAEPGPGVAIVDVVVTTFRLEPPDDDPDALRTLDGDESTFWATPGLSAGDATVNGVGLEFRLAEATAVAQMAITSDTRGWAAAVYVGEGGYDRLSDWGLLIDQQTNTEGRMILSLAGDETESVLLWIPDPRSAVTDEIRIAEVIISPAAGAALR